MCSIAEVENWANITGSWYCEKYAGFGGLCMPDGIKMNTILFALCAFLLHFHTRTLDLG